MPRRRPSERGAPDSGDLGEDTVSKFRANLRKAISAESESEISARAGMDLDVLRQVLSGRVVPGIDTVQALEAALDTDLWPRQAVVRDSAAGCDEPVRSDG